MGGAIKTITQSLTVGAVAVFLASPSLLAQVIPVSAPATLSQSGATYQLSGDLSCDDTCFTVTGDNVTLDLNQHTLTYGNGFAAAIPNAGFELPDPGNSALPANWNLSQAPGAKRVARTYYWDNYELRVDMGTGSPQTIRSTSLTLQPGKTYNAFAWVRSPAGSSATLALINDAGGATLASGSSSGDQLHYTGYAIEFQYKPSAPVSVHLEMQLVGTGAQFFIDGVDLKPTRSFGVVAWNWRSPILFPDLTDQQFAGATAHNLTVKNGRLVQGAGQGTRSSAVLAMRNPHLLDLNVTANGANCNVLDLEAGGFEVRRVRVDHTSLGVFNRQMVAGLIYGSAAGTIVIADSTLNGGAQQGISLYLDGGEGSVLIENNTIANYEKVTDGYAIALSGVRHFKIHNNQIKPLLGRGILLDTTTGNGPPTNLDGEIWGNTIEVKEKRNHEFGEDGLQAAGIRIRDYSSGYNQATIHDNAITAWTAAGYVNEAAGIVGTVRTAGSNLDIYNNTVRAYTSDAGKRAYAVLMEETGGNSVAVAFRANTLISNDSAVRLGDYDQSGGTANVQLTGNAFQKGTEPGGPAFHTLTMGYWTWAVTGHDFLDGVYGAGTAPDDIEYIGSGDKSHTLSWYLTAAAQDTHGTPLAGAAVTVTDALGAQVSGSTGSDGKFTTPRPQFQRSGAAGQTYRYNTPYTVRVVYQGTPQQQAVDLTSSAILTFTYGTGPAVPNLPSNLTATAVSPTAIDLAWKDNSNNENGFALERCPGYQCTAFAPIGSVGENIQTYNDTGLDPSTTYTYRLRAYNGVGNSGYSNTAQATTAPLPSGGSTDNMTPSPNLTPIDAIAVTSAGCEAGGDASGLIGLALCLFLGWRQRRRLTRP